MTISPLLVPPANPSPEVSRTWVRRILKGGQITETCPDWCTAKHLNDDNSVGLDDLSHCADGPRIELPCFDRYEDGRPVHVSTYVLRADIFVSPYSEDSAQRVPHIQFEPFQDEFLPPLNPNEFEDVIRQIEAHTIRLREVHQQLVSLRTEGQEGG
ncbi:DUF6907 domain-containing protein [Streptantibioticus silvisoli]|uniref:Uncharacterized protein n=1 Tax=Streptantibioticus silvisoli TaxID=2705255 RepID=A0ABT6VXP3_9ACTN|nr:hypothetical protein [Streptantibioticus silvisoli]MDI5963251.1 hypothetical protein [Streptantibioticus silvisoli]